MVWTGKQKKWLFFFLVYLAGLIIALVEWSYFSNMVVPFQVSARISLVLLLLFVATGLSLGKFLWERFVEDGE